MSKFFEKASGGISRYKICIFGAPGTTKTRTALQFPSPVTFDFENGAAPYTNEFDFARMTNTTNVRDIDLAIADLYEDPGPFKTVIFDPITLYFEMKKEAAIKRIREKKGKPDYDPNNFELGDVNAEAKRLAKMLINLDLNVIITARAKEIYGNANSISRYEPNVHKEIPYIVDALIYVEASRKGTHDEFGPFTAYTTPDSHPVYEEGPMKNRFNWPPRFRFDYKTLAGLLDQTALNRDAVPDPTGGAMFSTNIEDRRFTVMIKDSGTDYDGKEVITAGITGEQVSQILKWQHEDTKGVRQDDVKAYLIENYKVSSIRDLSEKEAELAITTLIEENDK